MPRKMDTRPLANDPGMEDKPLPQLTAFGQYVYHTILHRNLNLDCTPSASKRTFSFTSIEQFLRAAREIAKLADKQTADLALVDESVGGHAQLALTYPARSAKTGEFYTLRIAGEAVSQFVRAKVLPAKGQTLLLDVDKVVTKSQINDLLHALPNEEGTLRTQSGN